MQKSSKIVYFFVSLVFFILLDFFVTQNVIKWSEVLPNNPVFRFVFVENTGAAFSLLQNSKVFLICFALVATLGIIYFTIKQINGISPLTLFFTSILSAGIFCNMFERITLGFVRDYIKLNFVEFPIFNVSDMLINIGVFAIVVIIIKNNYTKNNETDN